MKQCKKKSEYIFSLVSHPSNGTHQLFRNISTLFSIWFPFTVYSHSFCFMVYFFSLLAFTKNKTQSSPLSSKTYTPSRHLFCFLSCQRGQRASPNKEYLLHLNCCSWACYHMKVSGSQLVLFCHSSLAQDYKMREKEKGG